MCQPIEIDDSFDNLKYFQIAVLVDRPDFLRQISKLRKKWNLQNALVPHDPLKIKEWGETAFKMTKEENEKQQEAEGKFIEKYPDWFLPLSLKQIKEFEKDREEQERLRKNFDFDWDIKTIRKKFKRPPSFDGVIKVSLLCGKVTKEDYKPCYATIHYPEVEIPQYDEVPELTIVLDQFTTRKEVEVIFKKELPQVKQNFLNNLDLYKDLYNPHRLTEIKKHRRWYLANKTSKTNRKKGYTKIALEEGTLRDKEEYKTGHNRYSLSKRGAIGKAIQRYKELLVVNI